MNDLTLDHLGIPPVPGSQRDLYTRAAQHVVRHQDASIQRLQSALGVSYVHAIDLLNDLARNGIVSGINASSNRRVLVSEVPRG